MLPQNRGNLLLTDMWLSFPPPPPRGSVPHLGALVAMGPRRPRVGKPPNNGTSRISKILKKCRPNCLSGTYYWVSQICGLFATGERETDWPHSSRPLVWPCTRARDWPNPRPLRLISSGPTARLDRSLGRMNLGTSAFRRRGSSRPAGPLGVHRTQ